MWILIAAALSAVSRERGALLVHVSRADSCGADRALPIREQYPLQATGVHGVTLLQGEAAILRSGCRYLLVRSAWLYQGRDSRLFRDWTLRGGKQLVPMDQLGAPTRADDLARAVLRLLELGRTGH